MNYFGQNKIQITILPIIAIFSVKKILYKGKAYAILLKILISKLAKFNKSSLLVLQYSKYTFVSESISFEIITYGL